MNRINDVPIHEPDRKLTWPKLGSRPCIESYGSSIDITYWRILHWQLPKTKRSHDS